MRYLTVALAMMSGNIVAASAVEIEVWEDKPVDIILSAGETARDLSEFEVMLQQALQAAGVDLDRVQIQAEVKTTTSIADSSAEEIFNNWTQFGGNVWKVQDGALLDWQYHCLRSGFFNHNWDAKDKAIDFVLEADVISDDWLFNNYFGFMFRVTGVARSYYAVVWEDAEGTRCGQFRDENDSMGIAPHGGLALVKVTDCTRFDYRPGDRRCQEGELGRACQHSETLVKSIEYGPFKRNQQYNCRLEWQEPGYIAFYINDSLALEYWDENPLDPGAYGLLSVSHTNRNIPELGGGTLAGTKNKGMEFKNLSITAGGAMDLLEAVRSPSFRRDSYKFAVDVCDIPREDFDDAAKVGELVQRLGANDLYYVGVGTSQSKESIEKFIRKNSNKGKYVDGDTDFYTKTAEYIASIVNKKLAADDLLLIKDSIYEFKVKQ